ncbi:transcriptional regulator family: Fungal Specific TF [Aspergillus niger]|nr:transcriptional regulator family: Fungal Specific TF [Aspergillus niger]KAI3044761.1 transcriptional regulator family: Fungal Specific TF [Aspergillus niger]
MLLRSLLVATISSHSWLLTPALKMLQSLVHPRVSFLDVDKNPLLRNILKRTFYNHFCAGENRDEVQSTISKVKNMGFKGVILTYAREIVVDATGPASKSGASVSDQSSKKELSKDQGIEAWREGVLETVEMIGRGDILALKLTGAGEGAMKALAANTPMPDQMMDALQQICSRAVERNARIFIDAEQQSVQTGIDAVALDLMKKYNTNGTAVVFNTYQAYLKSTPNTVKSHLDIAGKHKFTLGIKLVRGAYINSEPRGLINDTKPETDSSYNFIAAGIIRQRYGPIGGNTPFPSTELFLATHNRESALMADRLVKEQLAGGLEPPKIQYGQLLGMADGVSCKLLQIGKESSNDSRSVAPEVFKQVQQLLDTIRDYEERLATRGGDDITGPLPSSGAADPNPSRPLGQPEPTSPDNSITLGNHIPEDHPSEGLPYDESVDGISPATDLTSGPAFESQVRSLLDRSKPHRPVSSGGYQSHRRPDGLVGRWVTSRELVEGVKDAEIPSLEESHHLLDQFLFYLGVSQHFFDPRSFSDSMVMLFQTPESREEQKRTTWYTEYLLVMAMAQLMDVEQPTSQPPGADLFAEALRRVPPMQSLGEEGVIAVEILTLVATYLQWCDRRHDAYLYIGLALRLAIALGCNLPEDEQTCLPSQSAHRVRLWWTVYMLDRRLSSGLGLAGGADERQLRAGFPRHAVGFTSPVAIIINFLAVVTNNVGQALYGNNSITQLELVRKIQAVLQELYNIGSSLYLMLFQAIILCTRPILLRRVRLEVQRQQESLPPEPMPEVLARLCETCYEASTRSLAILYSLQQQRIIPRYGFFDLDATFSAAFVLVMAGFVENLQDQPPPALDQAFQVLQFLSRAGNQAAEQRFHDIAQSCSHVWPNYVFQDAPRGTQATQLSPAKDRAQRAVPRQGLTTRSGSYPSVALPYTTMAQDSGHYYPDESGLLESWNQDESSDGAFDIPGNLGFDLTGEAEGIYSSFHNPTMPLTGVDYIDWLEIEKVFNTEGT